MTTIRCDQCNADVVLVPSGCEPTYQYALYARPGTLPPAFCSAGCLLLWFAEKNGIVATRLADTDVAILTIWPRPRVTA